MAAIDKIYGTSEQYDEFHAWCTENNQDALVHFYPRSGYVGEERPITNFPERIDMWMLENCPIAWVVARIKEQYGIS